SSSKEGKDHQILRAKPRERSRAYWTHRHRRSVSATERSAPVSHPDRDDSGRCHLAPFHHRLSPRWLLGFVSLVAIGNPPHYWRRLLFRDAFLFVLSSISSSQFWLGYLILPSCRSRLLHRLSPERILLEPCRIPAVLQRHASSF